MIKNGKIRLNVSLHVPEINEVKMRLEIVAQHWGTMSIHENNTEMQ